ncbi:MAG: general stress protein [Mojavia pulchra JT2-VF2]|jgi:hypothetical protein|uniref:General stress protein n=1 Tax=Mojavia pulchra JT2-VF2 TaxID=287848 RepID=A0A951UHX0_9NOST|nr:general stress protein [Mojavia pulchra JT2-VF2]
MILSRYQRAVGVFTHRLDAEQALHELRESGLAMEKVSVVVQNSDRNHEIANDEIKERTGDKADEGATVGGLSGGAVGGLTGLLVGLGTLAIPGVGPIMLAGATVTALATTLVGATDNELDRASFILGKYGVQECQIYDPMLIRS